ncbi:structural maintenance of chromosomes protein 4-like [Dendronephthya gigantea]|uniref:structural maintenance of chromosomes protein 4-like n=1 Tax=Dendronephthya gigantea TaxID=151771 RepID=UPI00106B99C4|nr:structural maintenance of chromosomes protein 4-like [Dendronephthya gigantea]XP_028414014.1 structural maintenance of chromosomes protein 4-like [Dendronephthya gigantea]XP_028414015.1 structural maintenance of chromosomes protein 4-like [Dendronephthya gigantea]
MKKYYYEDLTAMSEPAREMWMCDQCSEFGKEIENLMTGREKESFTEEMYRKLRQVTKRWTSWHHKTFGNVTSRQSVAELLAWEQSTTLLINPVIKTRTITQEENILVRFNELCEKLEQLHQSFTDDILEPMCEFFWPSSQKLKLTNVVENLKTLLSQWKGLLGPGTIDQSLFSEPSSKHLHTCTLRGRSYDYDSVIRLIPDILQKATLALTVVRKWRVLYKQGCLSRQKTYSLMGSTRFSTKSKSASQEKLGILEQQSDEVQNRCDNLRNELENCRERCHDLEKDLHAHVELCDRLEIEIEKAKEACDVGKERLDGAKKNVQENPEANSQQYRQVLQQELNAAKIKFCTKRIKLINARKRCVTISEQLEKARKEYETLKMEGEISQNKYLVLRSQLENFRRNIKIQGGMVDSLQQQCYALKKELDNSKASCEKVTRELTEVKSKCGGLEKRLRHKEEECLKTKNELNEALKREEKLRVENTKLMDICKAQEMPSDESSLTTPIER